MSQVQDIIDAVKSELSGRVAWVEPPLVSSEVKLAPRVVCELQRVKLSLGSTRGTRVVGARQLGTDHFVYSFSIFSKSQEQTLLIRSALLTALYLSGGADVEVSDSDLEYAQGTGRGVSLRVEVTLRQPSMHVTPDSIAVFSPGSDTDLEYDAPNRVRTVIEISGSDVGTPSGNMSPIADGSYSSDGSEAGSDSCGTT